MIVVKNETTGFTHNKYMINTHLYILINLKYHRSCKCKNDKIKKADTIVQLLKLGSDDHQ